MAPFSIIIPRILEFSIHPCAFTYLDFWIIFNFQSWKILDIQQKIYQIEKLMMELRIKGIISVFLVWDSNNDICIKGNLPVGNLLANFHTEFVSNIEQNDPTYWIDRMVIPKLKEPIDSNPKDIVRKHLSKIVRLEQNLGKAHIDYSTKPDWWDEKIKFSKDYSITGKMNKLHLVQMIENAYKHHVTDATGVHIERSQLALETAIMDKNVFLSKLFSDIVPSIQDRVTKSCQQQEPNEIVSIDEGRQGSVEKSDLHQGTLEIGDAETVAMVASLSSLSIINRYLLPHNQNLIQGRVYIPETLTVPSSSSSQRTINKFMVPIPDPICSTRVVPVGQVLRNSNSQDVLQSTPVTEVQGDNDGCHLEPMEIEMSPTVTHISQHEPCVLPSITYKNHEQGGSCIQYIEKSMDIQSKNHDSQHIYLDNYDYRLIDALDLGLTPINDDEISNLNKSMDVSTTNYLF